jgi:ABC-2 type transport system permease protein
MAGLNGTDPDSAERKLAAGGGLLSPLARAQYAALAGMRWRVFINGLRSKLGAFEMGARTISFVVYALMGLGIGAAQGAFAYGLASDEKWPYFAILFWVTCLLWQAVPIMLASFQEQFDLGSLLRFPVSFRSFFLLYVVFGFSDVSTILGGLCCIGILVGVTVARPDLFVWTAPTLAVFAAFNILLVRAVFAWIDRWLAQRKTREILGALFMVLVLSVQLINPALHQTRRHGQTQRQQKVEMYRNLMSSPWFKTANEVQRWLPPGLAAIALQQAALQPNAEPALEPLGVLGLFVLAAGSVLGLRLRGEFRGENLGAAPARTKTAASHGKAVAGRDMVAKRTGVTGVETRLEGSGPVAAIVQKEMRSLVRTLPLMYAVGAPLVLVLVVSGAFLRGGSHMAAPVTAPPWAFALCVFFAQIGFRQLFSNNLGAEGAGIQLYFLSPTPMRTVLLAKNLFHAGLFAVAVVIAGLLAAVRLGAPDGVVAAATVAWLLFVLPSSLAVGNIFSLTMPYRINPGRISRQRGSQASTLLSLLLQGAMLGVGAMVYAVCSLGGMLWLAVPIFLVLAVVAVFAWLRILGNADEIASQRKDLLISTLVKAE